VNNRWQNKTELVLIGAVVLVLVGDWVPAVVVTAFSVVVLAWEDFLAGVALKI
jgi:hypothetical protein